MASSNKTTNGLNSWVLSDIPKMEDFNSDNVIIDAAITKAEHPLEQIADGEITADKLESGILGFGTVVGRAHGPVNLTPLVPATPGAPLYVYAGDNIRLENWSEGDDRQQLYIGVCDVLSSYGEAEGVGLITKSGVYTVAPDTVGVKPESDYNYALLICTDTKLGFAQYWLGKGFYRRIKVNSQWGDWQSIAAGGIKSGSVRPEHPLTGDCFFDTSASKPVWWNSALSKWVDATGAEA